MPSSSTPPSSPGSPPPKADPPPEPGLPGGAGTALLGALLVLPTGFLQLWLEPLVACCAVPGGLPWALVEAFLVTALVEEAAKLLALQSRLSPPLPRGPSMRAGAWLGVGFGGFEALFYLGDGPAGWLVRLGAALPSHVLDGALLGAFLAGTREPGGPARPPRPLAGLALVTGLHGLWDLGVLRAQAEDPRGAMLVPLAYLLQVLLVIRLARSHPSAVAEQTPARDRLGPRGRGCLAGLGVMLMVPGLLALLGTTLVEADEPGRARALLGGTLWLTLAAILLVPWVRAHTLGRKTRERGKRVEEPGGEPG